MDLAQDLDILHQCLILLECHGAQVTTLGEATTALMGWVGAMDHLCMGIIHIADSDTHHIVEVDLDMVDIVHPTLPIPIQLNIQVNMQMEGIFNINQGLRDQILFVEPQKQILII